MKTAARITPCEGGDDAEGPCVPLKNEGNAARGGTISYQHTISAPQLINLQELPSTKRAISYLTKKWNPVRLTNVPVEGRESAAVLAQEGRRRALVKRGDEEAALTCTKE